MLMASRFNRGANHLASSQILSTLLGKRSFNTVRASSSSMAAASSSALFLNPLTSSSSLRHFRCSPKISSLSFSARTGFSLAMKRQSRSFADVSQLDPSLVCEAVKRETGADGLNIADNVSQVSWAFLR